MALITIKEFAEKHNVTRQAIQAAIASKAIKPKSVKIKYGKTLISENAVYEPIKGNGR